jgi:hypothetical protein
VWGVSTPVTYSFAVPRRRPIWRDDASLPNGGWLDQFHTVNLTEAEFKRLQEDGLFPEAGLDAEETTTVVGTQP